MQGLCSYWKGGPAVVLIDSLVKTSLIVEPKLGTEFDL